MNLGEREPETLLKMSRDGNWYKTDMGFIIIYLLLPLGA
jgi:hypothetical protein